MELRKVIFALKYQPSFSWIDKKGAIIDIIKASKRFVNLGFSENRIDARQADETAIRTLGLGLNQLDGTIEKDSVKIEDVTEILRISQSILEYMNLSKESIVRIGVRFNFINRLEFNIANEFFIQSMSTEIREIVKGKEFIDSAVVPVVKFDGNIVKFALGPLKKEEYRRYFEKSKLIPYDEGYIFDIDYFSIDFHSLRIDKFAEEAFSNLDKVVSNLQKVIENYANSKTKK